MKENLIVNQLMAKTLHNFKNETTQLEQDLIVKIKNGQATIDSYRELYERNLTICCLEDEQAVDYLEYLVEETNESIPMSIVSSQSFVHDFYENLNYDQNNEITYKEVTEDVMAQLLP